MNELNENSTPKPEIDDLILGIEMGLMTQQQVVADFQEVADRDIEEGAARYPEFAARLEKVASGGNAQIRSMMGGPDSASRAGLVDVLAGKYSTASIEVREKIIDIALEPLFRDNFFYVRMTVAAMTNPHLIGDIIREFPLANPGANYYEEDLHQKGCVKDSEELQSWLDRFGFNFFAATAIALQKGENEVVSGTILRNETLFQGAAHIAAATHDVFAEIKRLRGSTEPIAELTARYRSGFVDLFAEMVRQEAEEANWTPLRRVPVEFRT